MEDNQGDDVTFPTLCRWEVAESGFKTTSADSSAHAPQTSTMDSLMHPFVHSMFCKNLLSINTEPARIWVELGSYKDKEDTVSVWGARGAQWVKRPKLRFQLRS